MNNQNIRTVTLTLTQSCNLACSYCYENHKSEKYMTFETAKSIIDKELSNQKPDEYIEFDLFGGEPFLKFELLKQISEYIFDNKGDKAVQVFATTNGTLVHGKVQDWLKAHNPEFVCGLSLDGTRDMHNINRSNSYDSIDLNFFLEQYPMQDVKMTISQETLPTLAEGVIELHEKGFIVSCNLAYQIDWSAPDNFTILNRELHKLIDYYILHPEVPVCTILDMGISNVGINAEQAIKFCGAGKSMRSYDIDGRFYPCQFFMPLSVGEERAAIAKNIVFPDSEIDDELLDEKCRDCVIKSVCPNCMGANFAATGSIYKRDDNMCKMTKVIVKARSYFKAKQWGLGILRGTDDEIQVILRAILKIQEELIV